LGWIVYSIYYCCCDCFSLLQSNYWRNFRSTSFQIFQACFCVL